MTDRRVKIYPFQAVNSEHAPSVLSYVFLPVCCDKILSTSVDPLSVLQFDRHSLSFDTWCLSPQINEVTALARKFPRVPIILNHFGTPLGIKTDQPIMGYVLFFFEVHFLSFHWITEVALLLARGRAVLVVFARRAFHFIRVFLKSQLTFLHPLGPAVNNRPFLARSRRF